MGAKSRDPKPDSPGCMSWPVSHIGQVSCASVSSLAFKVIDSIVYVLALP